MPFEGFAEAWSDTFTVAPTEDTAAYDAIAEACPDVATAIDHAVAHPAVNFMDRKSVRNAMAVSLVLFLIALYVGTGVLPWPLGQILASLLGLSGVSVRDAKALVMPVHTDGHGD